MVAVPGQISIAPQGAARESYMAYAPERKEAVLKKMLPPNSVSLAELARQEGICEQTLYGWRTKACKEGRLMPDADLTPEGWTSRDKFAAVLETATLSETEIGEYCRKKGLHTTQLSAWRAACEQACHTGNIEGHDRS